jgi:thioredoxin reductase
MQDGKTPKEVATLAKQQVSMDDTVKFFMGIATNRSNTENGFDIQTSSEDIYTATKLIFATGIIDEMSNINGISECWGISVIDCPYCHRYEVRNETTAILGNGEYGFEFSKLISNWAKDLTLFTNGKSTLTSGQEAKLERPHIKTVEKEIEELEHINGHLQSIIFKDGSKKIVKAIYTRIPFKQHCQLPEQLGSELTEDGYIKVDSLHKTTIKNIFICGDNVTRMRTVANEIAMGTTTGIAVNKDLAEEKFTIIST